MRLTGWRDVSELQDIKDKAIIAALSNGSLRIMVDIAKHAGLPWDMFVLSIIIKKWPKNDKAHFNVVSGCVQDLLVRND